MVYDPVGGKYAEPAVRSLGWEGRYLVVGFAAGEIPKLPLNLVLLKSCDIRGVFWGAWDKREPDKQRALIADIVRWCAEGKLSAHVHKVYPLAETAAALKAIADRKVMGKIVLQAVARMTSYSSVSPRASASRAAARWSSVMLDDTSLMAAASTAASSV